MLLPIRCCTVPCIPFPISNFVAIYKIGSAILRMLTANAVLILPSTSYLLFFLLPCVPVYLSLSLSLSLVPLSPLPMLRIDS